jgi:hypothetical protein
MSLGFPAHRFSKPGMDKIIYGKPKMAILWSVLIILIVS